MSKRSLFGRSGPAFQASALLAQVLACCARLVTRVLLLTAPGSLRAMQVMQVTFALGLTAEVVFAAYVLNLVPGEGQRLTAVTQAAFLGAQVRSSFEMMTCAC